MCSTRRFPCPSRLLIPLFLATLFTTGCQTTVGIYLGNRARDLGECFRVQVGAGPGIGATVRAAGLLHMGVAVAVVPRVAGVGWAYGDGYALGLGARGDTWDVEVDYSVVAPAILVVGVANIWWALSRSASTRDTPSASTRDTSRDGFRWTYSFHWQSEAIPLPVLDSRLSDHGCWNFLPCVMSLVGGPYQQRPAEVTSSGANEGSLTRQHEPMRSRKGRRVNPKARVHAFDIGTSVYAGIVYARAGFSPGEFLDFLLGWL